MVLGPERAAMTLTLDQFKSIQRYVWSTGDLAALDEHYEDAGIDLVRRLGVTPGTRVLDIATGTGNAALAAARAGAEVTGLDLAPELFDTAQARAEDLGVTVTWQEGDAEALPYRDGSFDRVVSNFGVMFAPRHRQAAKELVRVLRPGGRFALTGWAPTGIISVILEALEAYTPPQPPWAMPSMLWSDPDHVRGVFAGLDVELEFATGSVPWVFSSPEDCVRFMEEVAGPVIVAKAALQQMGLWDAARQHMLDGLESMVRADVGGCWTNAEYLITMGQKLR